MPKMATDAMALVLMLAAVEGSAETVDKLGDRRADSIWVSRRPIPAPAIWAIVILGFGIIGGAVRSGRR
jgi:hypothetical protein